MLKETVSRLLKERAKARGPDVTLKQWLGDIAFEVENSDEALANWYKGKNAPNGEGLMGLFAYFGKEFTSEVLSEIHMVAAYADDVSAVTRGNELAEAQSKISGVLKLLEGGK